MKCPFGGFRAEECIVRHNDAVESIENEEQCVYSLCAKCSAVKYYLKYKKDDKSEEKKTPNGYSYISKTGNRIIVCGLKNPAMSSLEKRRVIDEVNIDPYILRRFKLVTRYCTMFHILSYDELLIKLKYKHKKSPYFYVRDNKKGLEIFFKHFPIDN